MTATPPSTPTTQGCDFGPLVAEILNRYRSDLQTLTIEAVEAGLILRGVAFSYYGKQMALHEVSRWCDQPVVGNFIEVRSRW
ncbi:MAG: hypothetical protein RMJ56_04505 [Gemmataceae bacterium]|nr:hypothetical protein [Gemmata sp.]MDW8196850.1 hypothetical protein [Gemmataceae bacterium]